MVPPPISLVVDEADLLKPSFSDEHIHVTCPEHRYLVEQRAKRQQDEGRFAWRDHGRPPLGPVGSLEQERRDLANLLDRLDAAGQDVSDLRAHVRDIFGEPPS
jgi:hypothetical protein